MLQQHVRITEVAFEWLFQADRGRPDSIVHEAHGFSAGFRGETRRELQANLGVYR